jgi:hypothetical protein
MRIWLAVTLLLCSGAAALVAAERITYRQGDVIDLPLEVSTAESQPVRVVYFPDKIVSRTEGARAEDIQIEFVGNTVAFRLINPAFSGRIPFRDSTGENFIFSVRAATEGESPDPTLIVERAQDVQNPGAVGVSRDSWPTDTDSAATILMRAMVSGRLPEGVTAAPVGSMVEGKVVAGSVLHEDDLLKISVVRIFTSPNLKGYVCLYQWKGDKAVRVQLQRLYFQGAIGVYCASQTLLAGQTPEAVLKPKADTLVYYVAAATP